MFTNMNKIQEMINCLVKYLQRILTEIIMTIIKLSFA